jgi:hypothetical protein
MKKDTNRIAFFVGHPAHFHLFKNVANNLIEKGYKVDFLVKRKDIVEILVKTAGFNYYIVRKSEKKSSSKLNMIKAKILLDYYITKYIFKCSPDIIIGTYAPLFTQWLKIPILICNEDDADVVPLFAKLGYPHCTDILVPTVCNCGKWEHKAIKYESYHELAYLHPNHFTPDKNIVEKYFSTKHPYCIVRFAKLNAHHDTGIKGISTETAQKIIDILKPFLQIYITSERTLEPQFEPYRININPIDIHHVMAFASLYIGDSQTMAAEAGVLGVPFVRFNDFVGRIGYLKDLEDNYKLGYGIKTHEETHLYTIIEKLISMPNRKDIFGDRKTIMLSEKIDYSKFLTWFIKNYPDSKYIMKTSPDYQYNFK